MNTTKTCKYCLGKGQIIINAGTGMKADCAKCKATKHNTLHENELSKGQSHEEDSSR